MTTTTTTTNHHHRRPSSQALPLILTLTLSLLLRTLIGFHPHSGQNNHHGSKIAYGGDFEAQRHWMEITLHLPLSQWYKYDTQYWGLDYPPLTAYGSYVLGWLSEIFVGSESVALDSSRGYEDAIHKGFMRASVIGLDVLLYFPIVYIIMKRLVVNCCDDGLARSQFEGLLLGALIQPALLIIDHGHFQYNAVCLAFALGSFHYMTNIAMDMKSIGSHSYSIDINCIIGSILFCLALNWKQMALYYAPAVFAYLLGRCFAPSTSTSNNERSSTSTNSTIKGFKNAIVQIAMLGLTVLATFGILWLPFYVYRDNKDESIIDVFSVLLKRIFPFSRGLFEGKVGNLWCAASVKPISIRERIPPSIQPLCALALTLLMILPFCIVLFQIGKMSTRNNFATADRNNLAMMKQMHLKALLWGSTGTSLSFFLSSFQVHEKSILLPLAPLSLLAFEKPTIIFWFSLVAVWSMWHLIVVDRLQVPYFSLIILFSSYVLIMKKSISTKFGTHQPKKDDQSNVLESAEFMIKCTTQLSAFAMMFLHLLEAIITPPSNLPDLFPVLWVIGSCVCFCFMWLISLLEISFIYFYPYSHNVVTPNHNKKIN